MKNNERNMCLWVCRHELTEAQETELATRWMVDDVETAESMSLGSRILSSEEDLFRWKSEFDRLIEKYQPTVVVGDWPAPVLPILVGMIKEMVPGTASCFSVLNAWQVNLAHSFEHIRFCNIGAEPVPSIAWGRRAVSSVKKWNVQSALLSKSTGDLFSYEIKGVTSFGYTLCQSNRVTVDPVYRPFSISETDTNRFVSLLRNEGVQDLVPDMLLEAKSFTGVKDKI